MAIVLDPAKAFVTITIYYIENRKEHGNVIYYFIKEADQYQEWQTKGYRTKEQIEEEVKPTIVSVEDAQKTSAGLPHKQKGQEEHALKTAVEKLIATKYQDKLIRSLTCQFKQLTWKEHNTILARSTRELRTNEGSTMDFDPLLYRELKLKATLRGWDAKDDAGYELVFSTEMIDNLAPKVAEALIYNYEKVCEPSEEDLKNL